MNQDEYPSDSDASDEDFRPDKEEPDSGSELDSEEDELPESSEVTKGKKRKRRDDKGGVKKSKGSNKPSRESSEEKNSGPDEDEEKKRTDELWASFLGGESSRNETATATKSNSNSTAGNSIAKVDLKTKASLKVTTNSTPASEKEKATVAQLFEFAGEQVVLTGARSETCDNNIKKSADRTALSSVPDTSSSGVLRRSGGGLGAVLNQINKKNKLTTLEKTKLDWTSFKHQEGIAEELQTHNKGKDGFLERRDFLERTDVRQFEIEKSFRQTKRSNR